MVCIELATLQILRQLLWFSAARPLLSTRLRDILPPRGLDRGYDWRNMLRSSREPPANCRSGTSICLQVGASLELCLTPAEHAARFRRDQGAPTCKIDDQLQRTKPLCFSARSWIRCSKREHRLDPALSSVCAAADRYVFRKSRIVSDGPTLDEPSLLLEDVSRAKIFPIEAHGRSVKRGDLLQRRLVHT